MALGDQGYRGFPEKVHTKDALDSREVRKFKNRVAARHETFNGRIKNFASLANRWRHGLEKHKIVLEAICIICQYDIDNGRPLFEV